jgi:hypothetical protein
MIRASCNNKTDIMSRHNNLLHVAAAASARMLLQIAIAASRLLLLVLAWICCSMSNRSSSA